MRHFDGYSIAVEDAGNRFALVAALAIGLTIGPLVALGLYALLRKWIRPLFACAAVVMSTLIWATVLVVRISSYDCFKPKAVC